MNGLMNEYRMTSLLNAINVVNPLMIIPIVKTRPAIYFSYNAPSVRRRMLERALATVSL